MLNKIKESTISKFMPKRDANSHKGENGRVLIIGGSIDYYGAPILAGLGALYSGADLAILYVPESNFECSRSLYPDFIVKKYPGEYLTQRYASKIIEFAKEKADSVLIGPGLGDNESTLDAVYEIVSTLNLPTVLDANAIPVLKKIAKFPLPQSIVITPHSNEFKNLVDREIYVKEQDTKSIILLRSVSMDLHITVLLKGATDYISSHEGIVETNHTGNAGMTVGGSGDVLAGVVATFLAQRLEPFDAARAAAYFNGKAGDYLQKLKGFGYSASDLALALPYVMK